MDIQDSYQVQIADITLTYKLRDQLQDLELAEEFDKLKEDKKLSEAQKRKKMLEYALADLISIEGLTKGGKPVTIEEVKGLKIPGIHIDMIINSYVKHKQQLTTGLTPEQAEKNA
jgi:hypothetical protein